MRLLRRAWAVFVGACVLLLLGVGLWLLTWPSLPRPEEVLRMEADISYIDRKSGEVGAIRSLKVDVPSNHFASVLGALMPCRRANSFSHSMRVSVG